MTTPANPGDDAPPAAPTAAPGDTAPAAPAKADGAPANRRAAGPANRTDKTPASLPAATPANRRANRKDEAPAAAAPIAAPASRPADRTDKTPAAAPAAAPGDTAPAAPAKADGAPANRRANRKDEAPAAAAPIATPADAAPGDAAAVICRGVCRLAGALGWAPLCEVALANGRRADVLALLPGGTFAIIEVKSGPRDYLSDAKWPEYREFCDRLYFAVGHDFPRELIPADAGLIVADAWEAHILREPPEHALAPARRRALLLRFADLAARRLAGLLDPGFAPGGRAPLRGD